MIPVEIRVTVLGEGKKRRISSGRLQLPRFCFGKVEVTTAKTFGSISSYGSEHSQINWHALVMCQVFRGLNCTSQNVAVTACPPARRSANILLVLNSNSNCSFDSLSVFDLPFCLTQTFSSIASNWPLFAFFVPFPNCNSRF
jgi:hypothetical protein